jgi:hypothetical protein
MKGEHQWPKYKSPPHGGNQQSLVLVPFPEFRIFADHYDLGNYQSVNDSKGDGYIFDVVLPQQQHVVNGKGDKKEGQVQKKLKHLRQLMLDLLFTVWMYGAHNPSSLSVHRFAMASPELIGFSDLNNHFAAPG